MSEHPSRLKDFLNYPRPQPQEFSVVVRPIKREDRCAGQTPLYDTSGQVQAWLACQDEDAEIYECEACGRWFCEEHDGDSAQFCPECMELSPAILQLLIEFRARLRALR